MSEAAHEARRDAVVVNAQGVHARPVMQFIALASRFRSEIAVRNLSRRSEPLDGKSALQMILLEATRGNVLRIEAVGDDANDAVTALADLVARGFTGDSESEDGADTAAADTEID